MKLISFYDVIKYKNEERVFSPATVAVIDYLSSSLKVLGEEVEIISAAETKKENAKFQLRSEYIEGGIKLTQCASKGYRNRMFRGLSKMKSRLWLVKYLLKNTQNGELVFVCHSPVLFEPLLLFKVLSRKRIKVLYFASEIYQEVIHLNFLKRKMEWVLFEKADKLLVSTQLLNNKINLENKPHLFLYGTYTPTKEYMEKFNDEYIHIVYAGIINSSKGSRTAVEISKYLPSNYWIHILGFGKNEDVENLKNEINNIDKKDKCRISYEGILSGEEYNRFLQKCEIGLCPQDLNAKYNESSFPSKILSYMSNGLRVVSVDLKAIRTSEVGEYIYYTNSDKPEDFANTIQNINIRSNYDSRKVIKKLNDDFLIGLKNIIKE